MRIKNDNREGLFKSILLAYFILVLHVVLLAGVGLLVLFFGGLVRYLFWIMLIGVALISLSGYLYYRRLRREGRSLREALSSPAYRGRAVEISIMGGMVSFRIGAPEPASPMIDAGPRNNHLSLEDPEKMRLRDIEALARLLEKNLITPEEFAAAKSRYFGR